MVKLKRNEIEEQVELEGVSTVENPYDDSDYEEHIPSIADEFVSERNKNGGYILKYNDTVVLTSKEPFKIEEPGYNGITTNYGGFYGRDIEINDVHYLLNDKGVYSTKEISNDKNPSRYGMKIVEITNISDPEDSFETVKSVDWRREGASSYFDMEQGFARVSSRRDVGRGYTPTETILFLARDGKILTETMVAINSNPEHCGARIYADFMKKVKESGIDLTSEERENKKEFLLQNIERNEDGKIYLLSEFNKDVLTAIEGFIAAEDKKDFILRNTERQPDLAAFIPPMLKNGDMSLEECLSIPDITKQKDMQKCIFEHIKSNQIDTAELLNKSLSEKGVVSNLPFVLAVCMKNNSIDKVPGIYNKLLHKHLDNYKRNEEYNRNMATAFKLLLDNNVKIDDKTFYTNEFTVEEGFKDRCYRLTLHDKAAILAKSIDRIGDVTLYSKLVGEIKDEEDGKNLLFMNFVKKTRIDKGLSYQVFGGENPETEGPATEERIKVLKSHNIKLDKNYLEGFGLSTESKDSRSALFNNIEVLSSAKGGR